MLKYTKKGLDKKTLTEIRQMIGFYEPDGNGKWEVTTISGGYTADNQFEAEVVSALAESKAMLIKVSREADKELGDVW